MKKINFKYSEIFLNKTYISIQTGFILFLIFSIFNSCNFNYPAEKPETLYSTDLVYQFDTGTSGGIIDFSVSDAGNLPYQVIVYPKWIDIKKFEGILDNGYCSIPFEFYGAENYVSDGRAEGYIFIRIGKAEIFRLTVDYGIKDTEEPSDEGKVPLYCSTAEIKFGAESGSSSFTIANQGQVDKSWYITNIPSWLQLSQTSGNLFAGTSLTISCTVNREGLNPGQYSQIIHIESNNPQLSHGIYVEMTVETVEEPVISLWLKWLTGTVMDACYSKETGYLYILTKSPNNLLVKLPNNDSLLTFPLERIPNCIDITADGSNIAIGYNQAFVDLRDAKTMDRIQLYETDCVPFDLVFGENGWCYLAPETDQHVHLYSLNLTSGVTFRTESGSALYEKSILRKMPGKPYLYVTRPQLSPSGVLIVNIQDGEANDTIPGWHEDTGAMIWLSDDGGKIIGGNKEIYRTPEYTTDTYNLELPGIGTFDIPRNYIKSLDYNKNLQCYFASGTDYWWGTDNASTIYQVNEVSFSAEKSLKVNSYPGYLDNKYNPAMDVHYVFSDKQGTLLFAIKNVERDLEMNVWALETFALPLD